MSNFSGSENIHLHFEHTQERHYPVYYPAQVVSITQPVD